MALLEMAAGQGHAYAMNMLGQTHDKRKKFEQAVTWYTKAAEAGLPIAMFNLGCSLDGQDQGEGGAPPDYPAAAAWYRRAADAGNGDAAVNLATMYMSGRGRAWHKMPCLRFPGLNSVSGLVSKIW